MLSKLNLHQLTILFCMLFVSVAFSQEFKSFTRTYPTGETFRYQANIKGDLTFVSNNILNRESNTRTANDPYNNQSLNTNNYDKETGGSSNYNDRKDMQYIDVDNDSQTFSSSSANLDFSDANCSRIVYAALYWAATYPSATVSGGLGSGRQNDFNQVKLKVPGIGQPYVDITADEVLYDGFTSSNAAMRRASPYACFADITDIITPLTNPTGVYTVANVRSVTGQLSGDGGASAGWTMVVVYENPNVSGKLITTFDGFAKVWNNNAGRNVTIDYSGFKTIPIGPVRANLGAAVLEGDFAVGGDQLLIRENSTDPFVALNNAANPVNNFFNSNITLNGTVATNRNPNSINTLGFDTDILLLNNPGNSILGNGATQASFRFTSSGDTYFPFFNSFNVEIIEPEIVLEKRVQDIAGNDITGQGVNLGQTLQYVLTFENTGNDDTDNLTIRDVLPLNVALDETNLTVPPGVTYTYDNNTREVIFRIPKGLVEENDTKQNIRIRVKVAENCFDFVDACSTIIQNLAYATYQGVLNDNQITDDPSVSNLDNCGLATPGATNFLLDDIAACGFDRTVQLCGDFTVLDAGDNFDSYIWVRDDNNNGQIDASDTVLNDGDPDNDPSTIVVTTTGTYIVDKIVADPCKDFNEVIIVERFGSTQTNPIVDFFNSRNNDTDDTNDIQGEIAQCSIDGSPLPKVFLCGLNDSELIQVNIPDAQSMSWEFLNEVSCTSVPDDCANRGLGCSWNQVGTGGSYNATTPGKYRLVIRYANGCSSNFYFDVFQNTLDVQYTKSDIFCSEDGNITITNLGSSYGYRLVDIASGAITVPFSANNGPSFDIGTNGAFRVEIVQLNAAGNPIPDACIFSTPDIGILDSDFQVDIATTPSNCNAQGAIKIDVLNVRPDYAYTLRLADGTLVDDETAQQDNTHTFNVHSGDYIIEVSTADGCTFTDNVTVAATPNPRVSAQTIKDIGCSAGEIQLTGSNGLANTEYSFAIWAKDGVELYSSYSSIPGSAYQSSSTNTTFRFGWRDTDNDLLDDSYTSGEDGDYIFVLVDSNNCYALSNEVTISDFGQTSVDIIDDFPISCGGNSDAQITLQATGGVTPYTYSIDNGATTQTTPTFVNLGVGNYDIQVTDSSGCTVSSTHTIDAPIPLSASAGISRDATCDPNGAEVRITNVVSGTIPYEYSFDGGSNYDDSTIEVLPPGDYTVIVRDARGCTFEMDVSIEDVPPPPTVVLTPAVSYNCNGIATVTATPDITTYNYTYALDGVTNSPPESNVFANVAPGTYTVSTNYIPQTPPTPSILLSEDFGSGTTVPNPNTSGYFYENQLDDTTPSGAPGDTDRKIGSFEYAVTSSIEKLYNAWFNPIDHTTGTRASEGRYLAINLGSPSPGQIIYQQPINDIIPNQPLSITLWAINLLKDGNKVNADLNYELRDPATNTLVASANTGGIPKNRIWNEYTISLNPGAYDSLNLLIVSNESDDNGNDVAIDDILVLQTPEVCEQTIETTVVVEAGKEVSASGVNSTNVSCNNGTDGTITFEVENFNAAAGYEYSIDGGSNWTVSTVSPLTTQPVFGAGLQRVDIRKADETSCTTFIEVTITEPTVLVADANLTTALSCTNGGATITASASGGSPGYNYQLEDTNGNPITNYDFGTNGNNTNFGSLPAGDYLVRVRDNNQCEDLLDDPVTISSPEDIVFNATGTNCHSGANDSSINVSVTEGNGRYRYNINGGPWLAPTAATPNAYTFNNLGSGTYTVNVSDGSGCLGVAQTITIDPRLSVTASAPKITACATSTEISIAAVGGDTDYVYAAVPTGTTVGDGDFSTATTATITAAGDYNVYVRDNNGATGYCETTYPITITQDTPIVTSNNFFNVSCFGGDDGAISINVTSGGESPFEYSVDGGATYHVTHNFHSLTAGDYQIRVRDANLCESIIEELEITQPNQLTAEATITTAYTCNQLGEITVGGVTPTTGGSGTYQYAINGSPWTTDTTTGHVFTDLTEGTYQISVRDANAVSCTIQLADITIDTLPVAPTLTETVTYNCNGSGDITILPYDTNYTYVLNGGIPGQTGTDANVFTNIPVGTHTITVSYGRDCTIERTVVIEPGNKFEASITASKNLDCNADNSGTVTIAASNFGTSGYEYSLDGTTFIGPFTAPEQIIGLAAQAHTITVRDVAEPIAGCTVVLNQTLTEPNPINTSANVSQVFTCDNSGGTITANATGGTPAYMYQLEDAFGVVLTAYQTTRIFSGLAAGDYIVRAMDSNGCSDPIDATIPVMAPVSPTITVTPTACYSGANDASILVQVSNVPGNGGFQFRLNSGPWIAPTPAPATTHTFTGLANDTYTIDVRDSYGCTSTQESVTINPALSAIITTADITCNDGGITVNANGGDGNYAYAYVTSGTSVTSADFGTSSTFTVAPANDGDYDVYVWDNNAIDPHCAYMQTVTVAPAVPIAFTATPTDPKCYDGLGSIAVNITSGERPFDIRVVDITNSGSSNQSVSDILQTNHTFFNLPSGEYEVYVQDENDCEVQLTPNVVINNPTELTATVQSVLPSSCSSGDANDYGFEFNNYPTSYPAGTTIEFSADGGSTWTGDDSNPGTSDVLLGYVSGTSVFPSIRTVVGGVEVCRIDLPRYIISYPLDNLDITVSTVVVGCNELQVTVQGTAGIPDYEYAYTDDPSTFNPLTANWTAATPNEHIWTGLTPGRTYVFYVRDSTGCIRQSEVNVNDITTNPLELSATYEPSCAGVANDAEITYSINDTNGVSYPNMRWEFYDVATGSVVQTNTGHPSAVPSASNITISGLNPGEYYIVVTEVDGSGTDYCVSASENLVVEELRPITANFNKLSDVSCDAPARISVTDISGGGGNYRYTITGPTGFAPITGTSENPIAIPPNSPAGDYSVRVIDQFGCFTDIGPINLTLTPPPTIDTIEVNNCATPTSLTITATSTATEILYSTDGGTTFVDNGGVFNSLAVGTYTIAIKDSNGCMDTGTAEVYPIMEANVNLSKQLDCTASPEAEITITAVSGSGNYSYMVTTDTGAVIEARTALPSSPFVYEISTAGDYEVTVYDTNTNAPECNRVFAINVPTILVPQFTETVTDVSCNTGSDGTITMTETSNGINPLSYTISPAVGSYNASTRTFENLSAGTYEITGTGTNQCTFVISNIVVDEPASIVVPAPVVTQFECAIGNTRRNASIVVNGVNGGSNTYVRYEFINDQGTAATGDDFVVQNGSGNSYTETDLNGGSYTINVYDNNGCIGSTTANIAAFDQLLTPTITVDTAISCINTGENITINAFGSLTDSSNPAGLANYEFRQLPSSVYQTSNQFNNLAVGSHSFAVKNASTRCVVTITHEVKEPNTFNIEVTTNDVVCIGENGDVSFTLSDPTGLYTGGFAWEIYDSQGTITQTDDTPLAGATGTSADFGPTTAYPLPAGEYKVEIRQDSNPNCTSTSLFTIAGPDAVISADLNTTPITCIGNNGIVEFTNVSGGWGGYRYYLGTAAPVDPASYVSSPRFENLSPGTYQAWIIDEKGCSIEIMNSIDLIDPLPITADLDLIQPNCDSLNGEIQVINVAGGQGSNYRYQLQRINTATGNFENLRGRQTSDRFSGLGSGEYRVVVSDQWSCDNATNNTTITLYDPIIPSVSVEKLIDCKPTDQGGEITITQTGGSGNFNYQVLFPDTSTTASNTTGIFTGLTQVGNYVITVSNREVAQTCPVTITQELEAAAYPVLTIDSFTNATCSGADDGTIRVNVEDIGQGPYTFEIVSGSGSSLTFPISDTPTGNSYRFTSLQGSSTGINYTIRVTGANDCETTISQIILEPAPIENVTTTVTEFACISGNNGNNARILVANGITGGTGNYVRYEFINTDTSTRVQNGTNTTYTESNYTGGNYLINVYDGNNCVGSTTATIQPFDVLQDASVAILEPISCINGGEDVRINVMGTLSTSDSAPGNYEYRILPSGPYQSSNEFNDLSTGSYFFEIRNTVTNCLISVSHQVNDPSTFDIVVTKIADVQCFGENGQVQFEITDPIYTGGFTWRILNKDGTPTTLSGTNADLGPTNPINVPAGSYIAEITQDDFPDCTRTKIFTINTPSAPITTALTEEASPSCTDNQGKVRVVASGGLRPYTIVIENTANGYSETQTNVSAYIFNNLAGGDYDVTITDALGCIGTDTITLITPDPITASISNTDLQCYDTNTASVTATIVPRNVSPIYTYRLNTFTDATGSMLISTSVGQASDTFQNLASGFYSISVSDTVGCPAETAIVEIIDPDEVRATLIRTSPLTCETGTELLLSATGGSGSYAYSEDNITYIPMSGNSVGLPPTGTTYDVADTYRFYIRDEVNGCIAVLSNIVVEDTIEDLTLEIDESAAVINCNGENTATIFATATGGLGNYRYSLYTDATLTTNYIAPGHSQSRGRFSNLPAGTYYVNVVSGDCTEPAREVIISEPTPLLVIDENDFSDVSCFGDDDGRINIELTGGSGGYQYAISPRLNQFFPVGEFTELEAGNYTVIAQDQNGCFIQLDYVINEPQALEALATSTPEVCIGEEDGTISLTVTGGTAPYRTALNSNDEQDFILDRLEFNDLAAGDYIIVIKDANDCETNTIVTVGNGVNINATVTPIYECISSTPENYLEIVLEDQTVKEDVLYALDSTDPEDLQLMPFFRNTAPGEHYITIAHANGCLQTIPFEVEDFEPLTLMITDNTLNLITAEAQGGKENYTYFFNDVNNGTDNTYRINRSGTYTVMVIDENGCEVVQTIDMEFIDIEIPNFFTPDGRFNNNSWQPKNQEAFPEILTIIFDRYGREIYRMGMNDAGWDGTYHSKNLPSGDYWYIIKLRGENDPREFIGNFSLYR